MSVVLVFCDFEDGIWGFILCATLVVCGKAWMSPTIEGLMVIQMKNDPERGAEDLETFGVMWQSIGSIFYCIVGGLVITNDSE